jgi:hypothetical protein
MGAQSRDLQGYFDSRRSVPKRPRTFRRVQPRCTGAGNDTKDAKTSAPMLEVHVQAEGQEPDRGTNQLCRACYTISVKAPSQVDRSRTRRKRTRDLRVGRNERFCIRRTFIMPPSLRGTLVIVALAGGLLTGCSSSLSVAAATGAVGKAAPNFTLANIKGAPVHLSDYKGKVVLLNFWATWCRSV